jgi:putative colanic acid biosynthesis UDP-glucose lipid carrier transferase
MDYELMGNVPVLTLREEPLLSASNRVKKRVFDVVVSIAFLLLVYWWVYLIVATIIKITSPGPVYFKQLRNGMNGKEFTCIKFRSMRVNKDAGKVQATKNDPRKTKFGNFMRKTSIDELPQFLNVLKGDMSLVGPRPHMLSHTKEYSGLIDKYMVRHLVKPGITGLAQVTGFRGETKELSQMEGRVRQDIWYVENWSFFLDIRILFLTFYNAIRGDKQAY